MGGVCKEGKYSGVPASWADSRGEAGLLRAAEAVCKSTGDLHDLPTILCVFSSIDCVLL